jgi:site-specific DNA-methyltransferase (adenine-specific)
VEQLNTIICGITLEVLKTLPDNSVDAVVTDPPYGLGQRKISSEQLVGFLQGDGLDTGGDFMGAKWEIPSVLVWKEVYRVLKPGGHVLSFGGTRTIDLISLGLRAAGFEFRDSILNMYAWCYGSGMPKSENISKRIDKRAGAKREVVGKSPYAARANKHPRAMSPGDLPRKVEDTREITAPATPEAKLHEGKGTGLKPSFEPVVLFRKPCEGTTTDNVLKYGTGALNIDACRVKHSNKKDFENHKSQVDAVRAKGGVRDGSWKNASDLSGASEVTSAGRWPPNMTLTHHLDCRKVGSRKVDAPVINRFDDGAKPFGGGAGHQYTSTQTGDADGKEDIIVWDCVEGCPVRELDEQSGVLTSGTGAVKKASARGGKRQGVVYGKETRPENTPNIEYVGSGGASRFYGQFQDSGAPFRYVTKPSAKEYTLNGQIENTHPTKKPIDLMRWLVRLVCTKGGTVLDPYCGSGSTLHAACEEGMNYIGIDKNETACKISRDRMNIVSGREEARRDQMDVFDLMMGLDDE